MARLTVQCTQNGEFQSVNINPRWIGQNLAVHRRMIIRDDCGKIFGQEPLKNGSKYIRSWVVTHIKTGFVAGRFFSLDYAMNAAKRADKLDWKNTESDIKSDSELVESWKEAVYSNLGICG